MDWQYQLISLYLMVCNEYEQKLSHLIVRLSNNSDMSFSDEEIMTIYMNGIINGHYEIKAIYNFTRNHLSDWFPKLPCYEGFLKRINKISHLFESLVVNLMTKLPLNVRDNLRELIDSMPIILAQQGDNSKLVLLKKLRQITVIVQPKNYTIMV